MKIPNELQVPPDNPLLTRSGNSATALKALILITVMELSYITKARVIVIVIVIYLRSIECYLLCTYYLLCLISLKY